MFQVKPWDRFTNILEYFTSRDVHMFQFNPLKSVLLVVRCGYNMAEQLAWFWFYYVSLFMNPGWLRHFNEVGCKVMKWNKWVIAAECFVSLMTRSALWADRTSVYLCAAYLARSVYTWPREPQFVAMFRLVLFWTLWQWTQPCFFYLFMFFPLWCTWMPCVASLSRKTFVDMHLVLLQDSVAGQGSPTLTSQLIMNLKSALGDYISKTKRFY